MSRGRRIAPRPARRPVGSARARRTLLAAVVVGAAALAGGPATALWSDGTDVTAGVSTGRVGVQLSRLSAPTSTDTATGAGSTLTATLVRADTQAMVTATPKVVAVPLAVRLRADGNAGLRYSLALSTPTAGTVLAAATLRLFPVADAAGCTTAAVSTAAATAQPATTSLVGLAPGSGAPATATISWCLGAVYPGTGGQYTNTATASTTFNGSPVSASADWSAYVFAPVTLSLTHTVTSPGSP